MNLDLTRELEPASENDSDFKFAAPLPAWNDSTPFDSFLNCSGVVYVRLLCAQRLPCPVGSSVCAVVSLPPWQGRVRTHRTYAFLSSFDHGVCVRWEQATNSGFCSMVNAWSSEESPVPSIRVDLMFSPLGMGLLDFTMCSLLLPCEVLMRSPGSWKEQWCQTTVPQSNAGAASESGDGDGDRIPLIKLEAMFAPSSDGRNRPIPISAPRQEIERTPKDESKAKVKPEQTKEAPPDSTPDVQSEEVHVLDSSATKPDTTTAANQLSPDPSQPHLLRVVSFWIPATCAVCSTVLFGRNQGFHCEECSIQCCGDCRLHVDLQIPCGSEAARMLAKKSIQNKMSVTNILSIVAPDEAFTQKINAAISPEGNDRSLQKTSNRSAIETDEKRGGIGCLKLEIVRGCLFGQTLPADADPLVVFVEKSSESLRRSDYYARVSITDSIKTARTRTLQNTGMPKFGVEMQFNVAHYGVEFRLDVIDASTDATVGTTLLTTQAMLQEQRDILIAKHGASLFQFLKGPLQWKGKRPLKLELRTGVKSGFGSDFFAPPKARRVDRQDEVDAEDAGAISGWLEVDAGLEEYVDRLYGTSPYECPPRPPPELNMVNFQVHISRVKALIDDAKYTWDQYKYIISWKNPKLTVFSLVAFVAFCLLFNAEYCGSLPFLFLLSLSVHFSFSRSQGGRKSRFIRKEIEACRKAEKISIPYTLHRPMSTIRVSASRGKGLFSRDLGIPGKTSCHIFWDPLRCSDEKIKHGITNVDRSAESQHAIGCTGAQYSADPEWDEMFESTESRRLKQLLPIEGGFFEASAQGPSFQELNYPILQPFAVSGRRKDAAGRFLDSKLKDWGTSPGAIVIQVRFQDFLNSLPGFDHIFGEVVFPFSKLALNGEINGWFRVLDVGTSLVPLSVDELIGPVGEEGCEHEVERSNFDAPCIFVSLKWGPPEVDKGRDETNREISYVIQEELVRSSVLAKQNKFDLVGSSLGAVNTALGIGGNVQLVQNSLGSILDSIESAFNAFNFIDPFKSSFVFIVLFLIWLVLILIPTRYIILSTGLTQFAVAFVDQYGHRFRWMLRRAQGTRVDTAPGSTDHASIQESKGSNVAVWIMNSIRSLPTSEDLRKTYFWESRRLGAQESEKHASEKRLSRLKRLWKAQWFSSIRLRVPGTHESSSSDENALQWQAAFAIIQGHRFLWWKNVVDFDNGGLPAGLLFLSGHAGLTGLSPIEIRELPSEELPLVVSIFGRGSRCQERVTILAPDSAAKEWLESTVRDASFKDD